MTEQSNVTEVLNAATLYRDEAVEALRRAGAEGRAPAILANLAGNGLAIVRIAVLAERLAMTTAAPREAIVGQLENAVTMLVDELEPLPTTGTDSRAQAVSAGKPALEAARKQA